MNGDVNPFACVFCEFGFDWFLRHTVVVHSQCTELTRVVFCEVSFDATARTVCGLVDAGNEPELTQTPFRSKGERNVMVKEMANDIVGGIVRLMFSRELTVNIIVFWCVNRL